MSYYHYTKGSHLGNIVKEGKIRTTNIRLDKNEKPAAWLTKSPEWEVACNIGIITNPDNLKVGQIYSSKEVKMVTATNEYMRKEIGMCRILISEELPVISWAKFKYVSGISERLFNNLDRISRSEGSPVNQWLCTFNEIPKKYWEGVEMLVGDDWIRWDGSISIDKFYDLCMSCNGSDTYATIATKPQYPEHYYKEAKFITEHLNKIVELWVANKHKKGYIQIYIKPNYEPYDCGFEFIERGINKSKFIVLKNSNWDNYALVHFLWEATHTQFRAAIAYDPESGLNFSTIQKQIAGN